MSYKCIGKITGNIYYGNRINEDLEEHNIFYEKNGYTNIYFIAKDNNLSIR